MSSFLQEFWAYLSARKKFRPTMTIFGGLVALMKGSAVAPLLYTVF